MRAQKPKWKIISVQMEKFAGGLQQNDVADHIDVDVRTILNIENHKGNPKMEILFPLIEPVQYFL